ncbi:acyl-CoA dehydratase activase [Desulfosudis oleivorans]|uniref:Putative CoA-substrate-specific enzyme activase n=1 Tax=Desulfosudis oleivorans (strain DSM 6200 / JCM 39069 / Hxd3) TaxID=96561 RepID=A8ZVZ5_DESOH|nr:acyl-CoA dehydratase activase [Desulfosudis oleivorans]ABW66704.1 putative CoA-substrate-specific enzyme activase [Desulfosudis oleivorans Hxd3]
MIAVGCDIGSIFTKAVLMDEDDLLASRIIRTTGNIGREINGLIQDTTAHGGKAAADVEKIVITGAGAEMAPRAGIMEDQITCVAAAGAYYLEEVELVIDIGGQSITAIRIDEDGDVANYMRNDKCASGSGRFLEVISNKLGVDISRLDQEAGRALSSVGLSSQCGVFMESEVISHVNQGIPRQDILAGVCETVANLVVSQGRRFDGVAHYTITGGVARIETINAIIDKKMSGQYHPFPFDPQLAGAIGAALLADYH